MAANSTFKYMWDLFMLLVSLGVCAIVPFSVVFKPSYADSGYYQASLLGVNILFLIDIGLNMRSATYDSQTGEEIS